MQTRVFGTDGIRDIANTGFLTPELVLKLGKVIGFLLKKNPVIFRTHQLPFSLRSRCKQQRRAEKPQVLIGRDTRISGPMIENALTAGLTSYGVNIIQLGTISTPALAYLTRQSSAPLGIMISASHNQSESNGIKIFSSEGIKIPDKAERLIEKYLRSETKGYTGLSSIMLGDVLNEPKKVQDYIRDISQNGFSRNALKGMKMVVDCANGATSSIAPEVFRNLGANIIPLHNNPSGTNINLRCGSLYPEVTRRAVLKHHARIGFSLDGDGDRLISVDEKGNIVDGDYILAILARYFKKNRQLPENTIVATVMSNTGLEVSLRKAGIKLIRTPVGDRNVADAMFRNGYLLGGEQSGHIIILNRSVTGDGVITALEILRAMKDEGKPLSQLVKCMKKYPQVLVNLKVKSKPELSRLKGYQAKTAEVRSLLGPNSQVLIRYSGTEPLLRIMIEAEDKRAMKLAREKLVAYFRKYI